MCLTCLSGTGVIRHVHLLGQVRKVLPGRSACRISLRASIFVSPARASRALAEAATSCTSPVSRLAGLYERPAPARVHERVRLPLASRPCVDKLVHGQRTSIKIQAACPHPHTTLPTHQP